MKKISELGITGKKLLIEGIAFLIAGELLLIYGPSFPELMLRLFLTFLWARELWNFLFRWFSKAAAKDPLWLNVAKFFVYGFLAGTVVLVIIYLIFRYSTVRLPLKPFFTFTSILLFLLCISFMGKGVVELTEAGVISGSTTIPAMNGYQNTWLNIYDRAETLIPQIMLVIASVWMLLNNYLKERKMKKEAVEESK